MRQQSAGATRRKVPTKRMAVAGVVAAVSVAAPLALYWVLPDSGGQRAMLALALAPFIGPLVFQLLSSPRPEWLWGLGFAAGLGAVMGIWGGMDPPVEYSEGGRASLIGASVFLTIFLMGMVGASIASAITRLFVSDPLVPPHRGRLKPWHVGAGIAATDVVAVVIVAGVSG